MCIVQKDNQRGISKSFRVSSFYATSKRHISILESWDEIQDRATAWDPGNKAIHPVFDEVPWSVQWLLGGYNKKDMFTDQLS